MNVSHIARLQGIQPSLLFKWKKQYQEGSLTAIAAIAAVAAVAAVRSSTEKGSGTPAPSGQEDDGS